MTEQQQKLYDKLLKKVNEYCLGAAAEDVIVAIDALVDTYECTGQTPHRALNAIKEQMPKDDEVGTVEVSKTNIRILENDLKAFEIIKNKGISTCSVALNYSDDWERYSKSCFRHHNPLTKEEWHLLKEVLK